MKKILINNSKGFFSVHFIFFFLLMTAFVLTQGYVLLASSLKDQFRKTCLTEAVSIERHLVNAEQKLFKLNAVSTALRAEIIALKAAIAAAVATYNAPLAEQLTLQLNKAYKQQDLLDSAQKALIRFADLRAQTEYFLIFTKNNPKLYQRTSAWSEFLFSFSSMRASQPPRLSVKPDSIGGKGPNYELESNYKTTQRVELFWNSFLLNLKTELLENASMIQYSMHCQIEAEEKEKKWELKINLDKP